MRCPSCNKFVGNDEQEPEVNDVELNEGEVRVDCRIVNACPDCGEELTEATLEMTKDVSDALDAHRNACDKCEEQDEAERDLFSVEEAGSERTSRSGYYKKGQWVAAGGRYAKTFYGASVSFKVTCNGCGDAVVEDQVDEDVQASSMDSLV